MVNTSHTHLVAAIAPGGSWGQSMYRSPADCSYGANANVYVTGKCGIHIHVLLLLLYQLPVNTELKWFWQPIAYVREWEWVALAEDHDIGTTQCTDRLQSAAKGQMLLYMYYRLQRIEGLKLHMHAWILDFLCKCATLQFTKGGMNVELSALSWFGHIFNILGF